MLNIYNVILGLHVSILLNHLQALLHVLDPYKECTTYCGIPNAYNNRGKLQKTVNNTEYVCMGLI